MYTYKQRYRPTTEERYNCAAAFVEISRAALGNPSLCCDNRALFQCSEATIKCAIQKRQAKTLPGLPGAIGLFGNTEEGAFAYGICLGTKPGKIFLDVLELRYERSFTPIADMGVIRKLLSLCMPFEAFLSDADNESALNSFHRQREYPGFSRPAIIRGIHYLDAEMAESIGGIKFCLRAPVYSVEEFQDGVLIQLAPGLFDGTNKDHLAVQAAAMEYFGL
jgi:hypothetical protein